MAVGRSPPRFPTLPNASTPTQMKDALLGHFFPSSPSRPLPSILRPYKDYMELSPEEVSAALASCSPSTAPGPDTIPYSVWKAVHRIAPSVLTSLLAPLFRFGHHPSSLKKANGVVLDKPGKPSYDSPSSFRIIVLLQTVSKILERIAASRLSAVAHYVGLLNPNQCASLPSLPSFDAWAALVDIVRTLQRPGRKLSSLFLDIKGGFDNVEADILCRALRSKTVAHYLVAWIKSFLSGRSCRLLFQGSPRVFSPVSVGIPQGSPIPPLLFGIYVSPLHISLPCRLVLSYVDNFALTTSSLSYRLNSRSLQAAFGTIRAIAHARKIDFSIPKTELIHWCTTVQRDPPGAPRPPPVALDGQISFPSDKLRWLGYWFVPNISSSAHFSRRLALSQAAFAAVRRLSSACGGLPPHLCHRLAYSLLFPILSYGADLFVPTKGLLSKMDVHWRQVQRWVTNCFRTTPLPILSVESCLPPLHVLCSHKWRMAALHLVCSPPSINPASARLCRSYPTLLRARALDSHRSLCTRLPPNVMPLNWRTPRPSPPVRSHLPVDSLAHLTLPLLEGLTFAPMINSLLLPDLPPLPDDATMSAAYRALQRKARSLMLEHWRSFSPVPVYYTFPLSLSPHPFMGLGKFMAGRIYQMRAQKSYLAVHPSWFDLAPSKLCPLCGDEQETFSHALLRCPAKAPAWFRHLQGVASVAPDSPLWSSPPLLLALASYIRATGTNFPPDMPPELPPSPASMVFPSSPPAPPPLGLLASSPPRSVSGFLM